MDFGINLIGYFGKGIGLGETSRLMVETLKRANIPFTLISANDLLITAGDESFSDPIDNVFKYSINVFTITSFSISMFIQKNGWDPFKNRYNIGLIFWETTHIIRPCYIGWKHLNEIWTMSRFMQETLSRIAPVPVHYFPCPIELNYTSATKNADILRTLTKCEKCQGGALQFEPGEAAKLKKFSDAGGSQIQWLPDAGRFTLCEHSQYKPFTFLFCFSFSSMLERKNPQAIIDAFQIAFPDRQGIRLIIKSKDGQLFRDQLQRMQNRIEGDSRLIWIDQIMDGQGRFDLMNQCDCYISLHRAEGFGLTLAEAILLNKPAIATGYSGNLDFMNDENSYLCSYRMVRIGKGKLPYPPQGLWAEPNVHHAAELMRRVVDNPEEAYTKACKAKDFIQTHHSFTRVGALIAERLAAIPLPIYNPRPWVYFEAKCWKIIRALAERVRS